MGNMSVLSELGSLIWNHPYVSCSLLIFFTPPFLPILKFFSPLLISTALFVVALVTMGPHFEQAPDHQDDETFLINASEFSKTEALEEEKQHATSEEPRNVRSWAHSWADAWVSWVEKKLQNENWKGDSLNDDNVSILQEAFAHRDTLTRSVSAKLATRRIPDEGDSTDVIPALKHSDSWSFDRPAAASSSSFFSPNPSFSRRHESEMNPLFENVIPPPIDYDMPPLITGPASITAPLFKSLEDDMDMDMSDDDDDDQHDHSDLEVGESTVEDIADHHVTPPPPANGIHHQSDVVDPPVMTTSGSSSLPSVQTREIDVTATVDGPPAPDHAPDEPHVPEAEPKRSDPEIQVETSQSKPEESLQDIPELEDVLPVENEGSANINPSPAASAPDEAVPATSAEASTPEPPSATSDEVVTPTPAADLQPHIVERSMSLPVPETHTDTKISEDLPPVDENAPNALSHAISLPAASTIILEPKSTDPEPSSRNTELGTVTTLEAPAPSEVSTKDKDIEAQSSSIAAAPVVSEITAEEEITHVEDSKVFHPDAPQLQITPPSTKVTLSPSPVKYSASAGASSSRAPKALFVSRYTSSEDDSGDEEIDLDSDVEVVGEDSDSDVEAAPPADHMRQLPHTLVQA